MPDTFPLENNLFFLDTKPSQEPMILQQRATDGSLLILELSPKTVWSCQDIRCRITTNVEFSSFLSFFNSHRAMPFYLQDPTHSSVYLETVGTGTGVVIQTMRLDHNYVSDLSIYKNGVLMTVDYTANTSTGLITFTNSLTNGAVITASYKYKRYVAFVGGWVWEKRAIPDGSTINNVQLGIITFSATEVDPQTTSSS